MESLAVVAAAIFLVLVVLLSWQARARAIREAQRLAAEAARGRELESIALDAASLLAATLQSIDTARASSGEREAALTEASGAARALSSLFSAARLYLQSEGVVVDGAAEGCVRVAIAVARSRGCGISVRGERTELAFRGQARAACELITGVLDASSGTLGPGEFVEVHLEPERVEIVGGTRGRLDLSPDRARELGWTIEPFVSPEGRAAARIGAWAPERDEDEQEEALAASRVLH